MQHINSHQGEERSSNPAKWLMTAPDSNHVAPLISYIFYVKYKNF